MSRRKNSRLEQLAARAAELVARLDPVPLTVVVRPPDADHPHGTRVRTGESWTVYADPKESEPEMPRIGPYTAVIRLRAENPDRGTHWDIEEQLKLIDFGDSEVGGIE